MCITGITFLHPKMHPLFFDKHLKISFLAICRLFHHKIISTLFLRNYLSNQENSGKLF